MEKQFFTSRMEQEDSELKEDKADWTGNRTKGAARMENDLIFPSVIGTLLSKADLQRDFAKALKAANLPGIRFHDLR